MKCPIKTANPQRKGCLCEREGCAWWMEEQSSRGIVSACAVAFMAVGDTGHPRLMNGEFRERE